MKKNSNKLCKRVLSVLIAAIMCVGMLPAAAFAQEPEEPEIKIELLSSNDLPAAPDSTDPEPVVPSSTGPESAVSGSTDPEPAASGNTDPESTAPETETGSDSKDIFVPEFPTDGSIEEQQKWFQDNVKYDDQSETLDTAIGDPADIPETSTESETPKNWKVFYNEKTNSYELTYQIAEDAEGDQTVDLTKALELLKEYAQSERDALEAAEAQLQAKKDAALAELEEFEDYRTYKAKYAEYEKVHAEEMEDVKSILKEYGSGYDITGKTEDELVAEFYRQFSGIFSELTEKPEIPESIKGKLEEIDNMPLPEDVGLGSRADTLVGASIRKFTIYLASESGHTYKYKDGSFTLATPEFTPENQGTVTGFDGQKIPEAYTEEEKTYNISGGLLALRNILTPEGEDADRQPFNPDFHDSRSLEDLLNKAATNKTWGGKDTLEKLTSTLGITYTVKADGSYEFHNTVEGLKNYLVSYYSQKDGVEYKDFADVCSRSPSAADEISDTSNSADIGSKKNWTVGGEKLEAKFGADFKYNQFYQSLLSFVYCDPDQIDKITGAPNPYAVQNELSYEHSSWTSALAQTGLNYKLALVEYMEHKDAWDQANDFFSQLLAEGMSVKDATAKAFTMAINLDGHLTSNEWQLTKWGWYNSIQLEQTDIDFSLTKKDETTGETIKDSETGFQVWYIDHVKDEDGDRDVKMYCSYDKENNSYTFTATESTVFTQDGELKIDYAMMKDIVYYLQETVAPEGYERDTNVYIIMSEEDYNKLSEEDKANLENFDQFLDFEKSEDGLSVKTDFVNVKIVTTPDNPPPPPVLTPDTDPDSDPDSGSDSAPDPTPEIPGEDVPLVEIPDVDIPEEDVPLADIPEEEVPLVDIPDKDVPLADVPQTGDCSSVWTMLVLLSAVGLLALTAIERRKRG